MAYLNLENQYGSPPEVCVTSQVVSKGCVLSSIHFSFFLFSVSYVFFFVQEAVTKLFQRALQYCDPLKLDFELLGLYERTEQHKLAHELLEKMCKKFKNSSEVYHKSLGFFLVIFQTCRCWN